MKCLIVLGLGVLALAAPVELISGDSVLAGRDLSSIQARIFGNDQKTARFPDTVSKTGSGLWSKAVSRMLPDGSGFHPKNTAIAHARGLLNGLSSTQNRYGKALASLRRHSDGQNSAASGQEGQELTHNSHDSLSSSYQPSLSSRSLSRGILQKRADNPTPPRAIPRRQSSKSVRYASPERSPPSPSQSTPFRNIRSARNLRSQSSRISLLSADSRATSPWRQHQYDSISPPRPRNLLDKVRSSHSPPRNTHAESASRGGSPWRDGGGAVTTPPSPGVHSIFGFNPGDSVPPSRVSSWGSMSDKAEASPFGPVTPGGKTPQMGQRTPVTPSTPLWRDNSGMSGREGQRTPGTPGMSLWRDRSGMSGRDE